MISDSECDWHTTLNWSGELLHVEFGLEKNIKIQATVKLKKINLNEIPEYESEQYRFFCEEINRIENYDVYFYENKEKIIPSTLKLSIKRIYVDETKQKVHVEGKQYIADWGGIFVTLNSDEFAFVKNNFHACKNLKIEIYLNGDEFFKAYEDEFSNMLERTIFIKLNSYNVRVF